MYDTIFCHLLCNKILKQRTQIMASHSIEKFHFVPTGYMTGITAENWIQLNAFAEMLPASQRFFARLAALRERGYIVDSQIQLLGQDTFVFKPDTGIARGFVFAKANVTFNGKPVPATVFLRGSAVAVLMLIVTPDNKVHIVITKQSRVPVGDAENEEAPAGMTDQTKNFKSVALKELEEEVGVSLKANEIKSLGEIEPSAGGCDESLELFVYKARITWGCYKALQGRLTGAAHENEVIKVALTPEETVHHRIMSGSLKDVKIICAMYKYKTNERIKFIL